MTMRNGYNKADAVDKTFWKLASMLFEEVSNRPCVFLSHKSEDKAACRLIGDYLSEAGIDYYLDELDEKLQVAANAGDYLSVTECIKKGICESTHMVVVVSEKTWRSPWVAFEVGYGQAAIIDKKMVEGEHADLRKLAVLTLRDISGLKLPDFLKTGYVIRGVESFNNYIIEISNQSKKMMFEQKLITKGEWIHPLARVLDISK
jgi:hypothetical protein